MKKPAKSPITLLLAGHPEPQEQLQGWPIETSRIENTNQKLVFPSMPPGENLLLPLGDGFAHILGSEVANLK